MDILSISTPDVAFSLIAFFGYIVTLRPAANREQRVAAG